MDVYEKLESEMVVSKPWVWNPMEVSHVFSHGIWKSEIKRVINYLINGYHVFFN
jgi:hypothetical protein